MITVDAMEYEQVIQYAIDKGKMQPYQRLYYVIQGIDTGSWKENVVLTGFKKL